MSADDSLRIIADIARGHIAGSHDPALFDSLLRKEDWIGLGSVELDYNAGFSAVKLQNSRQISALFKKLKFLSVPGVDKKRNAIKKFLQSNRNCKQMNGIFDAHARGDCLFDPAVESLFFEASRKIARVLGDCPTFEQLKLRFGPGATTLTKKSDASIVEKLGAGLDCSEGLIDMLNSILGEVPHLCDVHCCEATDDHWVIPVQVADSKMHFAPKDAETDRAMVPQPSIDSLVSLGLGDYMTDRMRRFGLPLDDQTINQRHALEGSLHGTKATLDLVDASNRISRRLVHELFPVDWALLLDRCRITSVTIEDQKVDLEMFATNGNGFTFPLETLIFWALTSSVGPSNWASVYGDDIVVNTDAVDSAISLLEFCGFEVNRRKSFWSGPFRESCGADYYSGIDIRPIYQKELISMMELFRLHNEYRRRGEHGQALRVKAHIDPEFLLYGPDGFGDGHLITDEWNRRSPKKRSTHGYGGAIFDTFKLGVIRDKRPLRPGDRVLPTYSIYSCSNAADEALDCEGVKTLFTKYRSYPGAKHQSRQIPCASSPIPERKSLAVDESYIKHVSKPGWEGYSRISIYTLAP